MKKLIKHFYFIIILIYLGNIACDNTETDTENPVEFEEYLNYKDLDNIVKHATEIFFLNDLEGWVIGFNEVAQGTDIPQGSAILLHTTDGGDTWTVISNDLGFDYMALYQNGSSFKFYFINSTDGFMARDLGFSDINIENENHYYYTTDAGATWTPIGMPSYNTEGHPDYYGIGHNSSHLVFAACTRYTGEDECYDRLYFVSHASKTITSEILMPPSIKLTSAQDIHYTDSGEITLMKVYNENTDQHLVAHSKDNGASWTYSEMEGAPTGFRFYMEFPSDNVGYYPVETSGGGLPDVPYFYKTTDAGSTWAKMTMNTDNGANFRQFSFADENNGLALGDSPDQGLYKTTDGGVNWTLIGCYNGEGEGYMGLDLIYTSAKDFAYTSIDKGFILSLWFNTEEVDAPQSRLHFYTGE